MPSVSPSTNDHLSPLPLIGLLGLVVVGIVAVAAPEELGGLAILLAVVLAGTVAALTLRLTPTVGFVVVVVLSLAAQGNDEGTDLLEIGFGVALLAYIALWYGTTLLGGRRFVRGGADVALGLYLFIGGAVGLGLSLLYGSGGTDLRSDLTCLLVLAMYFPAREVCIRSPRGVEIVGGLLLFLGLYAAGLNVARMFGALSGATELYEVVDVRIASGEIQMTASLICALGWLTATDRRWTRLLLLAVVIASIGGLILAKSRGPWLTALIGIGVASALLTSSDRRRLVTFAGLGAVLLVGASWMALGNELFLVGIGLFRRFATISTAATADISLLNRYAESAATWSVIRENPVLGYGWGAPVVRYDMIVQGTHHWGFVHNGYLWIWHKVGIWGLALFLFGYVGVLSQGVRAAQAGVGPFERATAAAGVGILVAYALLGLPSNPFAVPDQFLAVTLILGLVSGVRERCRSAPYRP